MHVMRSGFFSTLVTASLVLLPSARTQAAPLPLHLNTNGISTELRLRTSYAPAVSKAAPSVVYIYIAKTVHEAASESWLTEGPIFRYFFGEPLGNGSTGRDRHMQGLGSGVIVTEDGYIITNNHVVEGADEVLVRLKDGKTSFNAKIIGTDPATDIAVLKVNARNLPAITLTDSEKLEVGDAVLAIGNPFGVGQTVTSGIVSAKGRGGMGIVDYEDFIQTDTSINPGNSGGALIDVEGRLVGINTAILSGTGGSQGIGFAVPSNLARNIMEKLVQSGRVQRGFLGVVLGSITPDVVRSLRLPNDVGVLVTRVPPGTPAARGGLHTGDVITEFNGERVADYRSLRLKIAQAAPKSEVGLKVIREGSTQTLKVTMAERPGDEEEEESTSPVPRRGDGDTGIQLTDINDRLRAEFSIPRSVQGAFVTQVSPAGRAHKAGFRSGDIIIEINRLKVKNTTEAVAQLRKQKSAAFQVRVWRDGSLRYLTVEAAGSNR